MFTRLPAALAIFVSLAAAVTATCPKGEPSGSLVPRATGHRCGSELTPEAIVESEAISASLLALNECSDPVTGAVENFVVPVFFNVIYDAEIKRRVQGNVTNSQIHEQIRVLNRDFKETGLSFELLDIVRTPNAGWFHGVGERNKENCDMKTTLRKGDVTTLNIYTVGFTHDSELLGYATFPVNSTPYFIDDGVVINHSTLPGGTYDNFNKGGTLTHEVGHWVGLYHTFEGGCSVPGDYVDDTPAEAHRAGGCEPRNSCPNRAGTDPIKNYMDYSDDTCADNFTNGQIERLRTQIRCHRGINLAPPPRETRESYSFLDQTLANWF